MRVSFGVGPFRVYSSGRRHRMTTHNTVVLIAIGFGIIVVSYVVSAFAH